MFDLSKRKLPQAVKVGGRFFRIHTDFKYFLIFQKLLKSKDTNLEDYDCMYIESPPENRTEGVVAISNFMNPPRELPRANGEETDDIVIDYDIDAPYIYAAFMEQYKIDLIETPLHYYKFIALLRGLHDTELNRIIAARLWKPTGKNDEYDKAQRKLYEAWRLPQPEDAEPDEALNDFLQKL